MREKVKQTLGPTLSTTGIRLIDEDRYTCEASNMMEPTNCKPQKGYTEKGFHLDVQYAAKITGYFASGFENQSVITVNENEHVELKCVFDSDPVANISIENGTRMLESGQTNTLIASIPQARCEYDATVYMCQGGNIHSTERQERVLEVFIKCAPIPSPFHPPVTNISRTLNGSVVLTFTIKAYPPPDISAYSWYMLIGLTWEIITDVNSAHKSVSADGLQTNLSISRLQKGDFGLYRVSVFNELGNATQEYELRALDKPESPKNLHVKEGSLSVDSFTVEWEPGFHGGEEQTFVLRYQIKDYSLQWTDVNVSSNTLNYSFVGLHSGTSYLIKMFARNIAGRSEETGVVTATTLVLLADSPFKGTAVAVGTNVGGIFCITLAVVGVWCMMKRKRQKQRPVVMQCEDLTGQRFQTGKKYESLGETTFHEYSSLSLDNTQHNNTECAANESSSSSTANIEYENLKLT